MCNVNEIIIGVCPFRCVMKIQNEIVSNASTKLKLDSRTVASVKALIKLADTQPVYRVSSN